MELEMELKTAIEILEYHQEWRLGKREDMIHEPKMLTQALDIVLNEVKKLEAKVIEKLWRKNYIFVYKKDGVIRCVDSVDLVETMKEEQKLIKDGWVHTSTIDPIVFIENLHNVRKIDTEL